MEGERFLILKNKGNCLFCQSPTQSGDNSLRPLLHSLQVKQVSMEINADEDSEPAQVIQVDLQGSEIKTGLCTECGNLNLTFYKLKQKMKTCLAKIKAKVKLGSEKDERGMKYRSLEGAIVKETLSRLNRKEPRVVLQDLPLSERSISPKDLDEVKAEVDDQDANEKMTGDVGGNIADNPSSNPITSEFDDPMEGSSSNQSHNGKRGNVSTAPDCSMHAQSETVTKSKNAPVSVEPSISKDAGEGPPTENSDGLPEQDPISVANTEPSKSFRETAVETVNGAEERDFGTNSACEQDAIQARLSLLEGTTANLPATVEGIEMKELELKANKVTLDRDTLKESLQIGEELHKLKAANQLEKEASVVVTLNETVGIASMPTANGGSGNFQVRSPTANPSEEVDVDSFPEVEAIIKDEDEVSLPPVVNQQPPVTFDIRQISPFDHSKQGAVTSPKPTTGKRSNKRKLSTSLTKRKQPNRSSKRRQSSNISTKRIKPKTSNRSKHVFKSKNRLYPHDQRLSDIWHLISHMDLVKPGLRCPVCDGPILKRCHFYRHVRIHTRTNLVPCLNENCITKFSRKEHRNKHMQDACPYRPSLNPKGSKVDGGSNQCSDILVSIPSMNLSFNVPKADGKVASSAVWNMEIN